MTTAIADEPQKKCVDCGATGEPMIRCNWDGKDRCIMCATKYGKENKEVK